MEPMTLNELLQNAIDAENRGVAVNWKEMCMTVYTVATNHIAAIEGIDQPTEEEGNSNEILN